ncbi:MAG: hypothetical protein JST92_02550 [Deltaproteobacteria bacterium]|nr:hypothetical protein [Deltaproteobacteria bacterium]
MSMASDEMVPGAKAVRYRFRVRSKKDGREILSQVALIPVRPADWGLQVPTWSDQHFGHGDKAGLEVRGQGEDGKKVRFLVEHVDAAGQWTPYAELVGELRDGVARVELDLHHPQLKGGAAAEEVSAADLRFHCRWD